MNFHIQAAREVRHALRRSNNRLFDYVYDRYGGIPLRFFDALHEARHMSGGAPKAPAPPPPPPMPTDPQIQKDAANARLAGKRRRGFGASILAGESSSLQTPADFVSKDTLGA